MTLPEHAICSVMIAQLGVRQRYGWTGVAVVTAAGIAPDLDTAAKLIGDEHFWQLHHALGHGLLPVAILSLTVALIGRYAFKLRPLPFVFAWCLAAALAHVATDTLYWWGVKIFWPVRDTEITFNVIEYLDLIVLTIWLGGALCLYSFPKHGVRTALITLGLFAAYVVLRATMPPPTGLFRFITGGWMYEAPKGTPVLDWW